MSKVIESEAIKVQDQCYEMFKSQLEDQVSEETMPLSKKDFRKIVKRTLVNVSIYLEIESLKWLRFEEILES